MQTGVAPPPLAALPATSSVHSAPPVGMMAADIPASAGLPDQGPDGMRSPGNAIYVALTRWQRSTAAAQSVVRIGMSAADIPKTVGQPDQGFEGNRVTGNTMYEVLTTFDLSSADKASVVIPGVATAWAVSPTDQTKWIFKLRSGVKFHDGSDFDADAVVWNVEKVLKQDAPHFDASQVGVTASRMPNLRSAKVIDKMTVELTTAAPDAL